MHLYHGKSRLTEFFWRVARRKGRKRAILAMARKLLVAVYWMLIWVGYWSAGTAPE